MKYMKHLGAFLWNTLLVYVAYTLCRLVFVWVNSGMYEGVSAGHWMELFGAGLIFDTSAILYSNALFVLLLLLPLPWKENRRYYSVVRWLFVIFNGVCLATNLIDCVYFPYTGKRTTVSVLNEFSHEGAGNMTKIFLEQGAAHWYLVLLFVLMLWLLWRLFRPALSSFPKRGRKKATAGKNHANPWVQVIVDILCIALLVPLFIGGMRGGFTRATRPITISNANQYVHNPSEAGVVLNTPFSIFRTFNKRPFVTPNYMSDAEAEALYTPVHLPQDSLEFRPMNVVVLIVESFSKQHIGVYNPGTDTPFTPFLDSLVTHGAMTWKYSYANGRKSIEGMPSVLSSIPNFVEPLFLTPASLNHLSGLARELSENKGYHSAFFHGAENGSMGFQAFARSTGFQEYWGRTEYGQDPNYGGDRDYDGTWAIWDEEFLQFFCDRMSDMKQPFITSVFTATSHTPFALPERYKGVFPQGRHPIQECVAYTDHALRRFFEKASRQPWYNNTLFVLTADHTSGQIDPFYMTTLGYYQVPIIFYTPGWEEPLRGMDTERIVEQIDIMPTVMGLLHYDRPYVAFGQDMLTTPSEQKFAIHWVPEFDGYEYVQGSYCLHFDGHDVTHAYRFRTDSLMQNDVRSTLPADTLQMLENGMKSVIQQYMQRMNSDRLTMGREE